MHPADTTRVAITLDLGDTNPDLAYIWAGIRAVKLIDELWHHGIRADIISIDINDDRHYS